MIVILIPYAFKPHQKYFLVLMINEENLKCGESNK